MASDIISASPDDVIDYGRFLRDVADGAGTGVGNGLDDLTQLARSITVPIPDETLLPGGAAFTKGLMHNVGLLATALEEMTTAFRGLGQGVEDVGQRSRSAEDVRQASIKELATKVPPPRAAGASPLGDAEQQPLNAPESPVEPTAE
ncbi:hypothetical protein [Streptomyces sp. NPDC056632]|uniref:hypothetical protein n=1 Tax=Streptomyces sp. NPDC056632 TaxID=3345884 RepID=UPI003676B97A